MNNEPCWFSMACLWLSGFLLRPLIMAVFWDIVERVRSNEHVEFDKGDQGK